MLTRNGITFLINWESAVSTINLYISSLHGCYVLMWSLFLDNSPIHTCRQLSTFRISLLSQSPDAGHRITETSVIQLDLKNDINQKQDLDTARSVQQQDCRLYDWSSIPSTAGFFPSRNAPTISGAHPASYAMGTGAPYFYVKQMEREADTSPPYSAKTKNAWRYYLVSPIRLNHMWLS